MDEKVVIFDTTLRDGEQAPGAALNPQEKLEVALQLERLGVNIIEAGFPIASPGDFKAVETVALKIKKCGVCGLARATRKDIDAAYQAVKKAKRPRIHVFLATSPIHRKFKLNKAKDEILRLAVESVKYAKKYINDIEFSPEDAARTEKEFLYKVVEAVIDVGAKTINIPDTVGFTEPQGFGELIRDIKNNVPNIDRVVISVHCHNDLGLASANSLSAVLNGARQVECTINGIGERAGNASLEEIVMAMWVKKNIFKNLYTTINTKEICKTSRLVSKLTGFEVPRNKAIVGGNAFRHESGIHQDGVLKEASTYEIINPEDVGFIIEGIVLGKHSGRHAFTSRLEKLGFKLSQKQIDEAFIKFKDLADKKKEIFDDDLLIILDEEIKKVKEIYKLQSFEITSGNKIKPKSAIILKFEGKNVCAESSGDGPVDACFRTIDKITKLTPKLSDYKISAVTHGKDAQGEVTLKLTIKNKEIFGRGSSTDVIEASIKAYLNAINKLVV
ncbi:MAG: 2-isopropylmalate synthase [Candidatus Omnitrophota bacterium]